MSNRKAAFSAESYDRDILNTIPYYDEVYNQIGDVVSIIKMKWVYCVVRCSSL